MAKFSLENQVALIAGGSQGLGKEFARKLYQEGTNNTVIVVSRSQDKLQRAVCSITGLETALELSEDARNLQHEQQQNRIFFASCDLAEYAQVEKLYELLAACEIVPTQVLLCAGGSTPGLFKDLSGRELDLGVRVNYMTCVNLAHIAVRKWPGSHLVFFSSEVAFFPFIGYSQYAPLKQSIKSLVAILRQECAPQRISCVYPGNFDSEGYALENETKPTITKEIEGPSDAISCAECCDRICKTLKSGYDDVTTDFIGWVLMSTDMGLNKQNNVSFGWPLQWLLGIFANLIIVPIYMLICKFQIRQWRKSCQKKN
ncbi:KR domain-containing protein [Lachancea thermotolerans]